MLRHLMGITDADRQRARKEILATTAADFLAFAERLDAVSAPRGCSDLPGTLCDVRMPY